MLEKENQQGFVVDVVVHTNFNEISPCEENRAFQPNQTWWFFGLPIFRKKR